MTLDTAGSRQQVRKELFDYACEQAAHYLKHLPRKERRRLAKDFALAPRREAAREQYEQMLQKQAEWDAEMESLLNVLNG